MDALKLVPQLFFDAIARVVPGLTALFLYSHFCGLSKWKQFLEEAVGCKHGEVFPLGFVIPFLLVGGYVTGHLISPFTKVIQKLGEALPEEWWRILLSDGLAELKKRQAKEKSTRNQASFNYDWLRLYHSEVGALCAKIRAEFEMYNGLCVVFLGYALAGVTKHALAIGVLALLALAMGTRGRATNVTFQKAVNKFSDSARQNTPSKS
ncbi:MAG TPA: hypothetical protein VES66_02120 [Terriglobales bacterium]|nr:hypothetical protein [Terriglobales bacterium]